MAEKVGSVYIEIQAKMGSLEKDLKSLEEKLKNTNSHGEGLASTFRNLATGLGVSAAVYKIVGAYKEAIAYGSKLQETQNKFDVVFRDSKEQATAFAKTLVDSYGLATEESMTFLAGTGDILIGMGMASDKALELSNGVAQLGIDLASFSNVEGGNERAIAALTSALTGEREALKAYGIVVNEELIKAELVATNKSKLTGMALKQAESEATLAIALRQSGNAIGDMARSFDSYANIQRRVDSQIVDFQAMIGDMLIPSMSNLGLAFLGASKDGGIFGDMIKGITKYVGDTINGIALLTAKLDQLRGTSQVDKLRDEAKAEFTLYQTRLKSQEDLKNRGILFGEELQKSEKETERVRLSAIEKLKKAKESSDTIERDKINNLAKIQKRIADEENGIADATVQKKKETTNEKVKEEQKLTAEQKKELEKRNQYIKLYGSAEMADFMIMMEKKAKAYTDIAGVATQFSGQLAQLSQMSASNRTAEIDNELQQQQDALQAKYDADVEAINNELISKAEKDAKLKALDEQKARDDKALTTKADKEKRKIAREAAQQQKALAIFDTIIATPTAAMQAYKALAGIPVVGPGLGAAAAIATTALGLAKIKLIQETPLPALAMGGIVPAVPGGNQFTIGEAGSAEAVIPLNDSTLSRLAGMINSAGGNSGQAIQVTVNLDGTVIYSDLYKATKDGRAMISQRAVVA